MRGMEIFLVTMIVLTGDFEFEVFRAQERARLTECRSVDLFAVSRSPYLLIVQIGPILTAQPAEWV